jgi:hypothetical protein
VAKPVAKVEPKPAPPPLLRLEPAVESQAAVEPEPRAVTAVSAPRPKEPERRPPPPVLPSLGKGVKATKKKGRDE